jgi:CTP:molybdopterin cytidylyltransferase MocA
VASSIRAGIARAAASTPACDGALILLVDQLRVDAQLLRELLARFASGAGARVAACAYAGSLGVPAVFPRALFPELECLRGDRGARSLLEARRHDVLALDFPDGALDVDTPRDLARIAQQAGSTLRSA